MKIYDAVEEQIRQAIANGEFDNLPNKGKPLDLTDWKRTPAHLRMSYSVLKSAGIEPAEVVVKRQISELKARILILDKIKNKEERTVLVNKLNDMMITQNIQMDRLRKK